MSVEKKRSLISHDNPLPVLRQCALFELQRSSFYYKNPQEDQLEVYLMNEIRDIWTLYPFYGYRRITAELRIRGMVINRKRVQRLMLMMGLRSILPKPRFNTSIANKEDSVRPYLLKDMVINAPNQVWATDLTYIKLPGGMVYLFALIDWHTRFVVGWKLATSMDSEHIIEVLHAAVSRYGVPGIVNSDQGSQFTCKAWIASLEAYGIKISHDGVGRCIDNIRVERLWWSIKYEDVFIQEYQTVWELEKGLEGYLNFYNHNRPHQRLAYKRPADLYVKKQEGIRAPSATYLSGLCPVPQDIWKRFEEVPDINDMRKGEGINLPLFKPLRPLASQPAP